jgi:hypothetical protein
VDTLNPGAGCQIRPISTTVSSSITSSSSSVTPKFSTSPTTVIPPEIVNPVTTQNQGTTFLLSSITTGFLIAATVIAIAVTAIAIKLKYFGHLKNVQDETTQQDTEAGTNFGTEFQDNTSSLVKSDGQSLSNLQTTTGIAAMEVNTTLYRPEVGNITFG